MRLIQTSCCRAAGRGPAYQARQIGDDRVRNVLYTGLWNTLIALFLTAANLLLNRGSHDFVDYFVPVWLISNLVGYLIHGTLGGLERILRGWPSRARHAGGAVSRGHLEAEGTAGVAGGQPELCRFIQTNVSLATA